MTLREQVDEAVRISKGTMGVTVLVTSDGDKKLAVKMLAGRRGAKTVDVQTTAEAAAAHKRLSKDSGVRPQHTFDPDEVVAARPAPQPKRTVLIAKAEPEQGAPLSKHEAALQKRRERHAAWIAAGRP